MKNLHVTLIIVFMLMGAVSHAQQQPLTAKAAHQWVKSGIWKNGLKISLHSTANELEFAKQYKANKAAWDKAIDFLRDRNLDLIAPGKYPIDGENVYASVTEASSKTFEQSAWESHKNYIDLQYVIRGKEKIAIAPVDSAAVTEPYDAAKDIIHYNFEGKFYTAAPNAFFLFFPGDAHRPNVKVNGYDTVKKLVIKIRVINLPD
ncbi:YhcH/YjgK/YiaL family protein [Mucilaginibacter sp.]|uniref:YhcH/YjgK/YiaL family protein n=1 Tax=Mucilaginibacter sp. TaxID=1882438 RepID=UPI0025E556CB|nr:YhcH/YjgK/YiaL family protein [Mucilaginibacter sp.]